MDGENQRGYHPPGSASWTPSQELISKQPPLLPHSTSPSNTERNRVFLDLIRPPRREPRPLAAQLDQTRSDLLLPPVRLALFLRRRLSQISLAHITPHCIPRRGLHELVHAALAQDVPARLGEGRAGGVGQALLAGGADPLGLLGGVVGVGLFGEVDGDEGVERVVVGFVFGGGRAGGLGLDVLFYFVEVGGAGGGGGYRGRPEGGEFRFGGLGRG